MWRYIPCNSEGLGKATYTILSEDNLKKCLKELNKPTFSLIIMYSGHNFINLMNTVRTLLRSNDTFSALFFSLRYFQF